MRFVIDRTEQYVYIQVQEDKIDALKAPKLKTELITFAAEGIKNMILDLSETKFVDSSGLSAVLTGHRICEANGGIFMLIGIKDHIEKLIKISMLDKVLHILPSKEEAIDAIFLHEIEEKIKGEEA